MFSLKNIYCISVSCLVVLPSNTKHTTKLNDQILADTFSNINNGEPHNLLEANYATWSIMSDQDFKNQSNSIALVIQMYQFSC